MSEAIISIENLGKKYRIQHQRNGGMRYKAMRDVIADKVKGLFRPRTSDLGPRTSAEDFWALKDVSFEVKPGEVMGIIGRNGAGKSTLLKILSRITEPTEGRVHIKGRVASLLEVGTGFHPELTGRENIFLNGAILGMSRAEIRKKFDEIVAFAEVEKFLDTPVKRYSSGMYVRLAFAVAAHLEPEILIVDEVLAVGDAEFQKKCLGKMKDVSRGGRTVLFVSHNMNAITALCSRATVLRQGRLVCDGSLQEAMQHYGASTKVSSKFVFNCQSPDVVLRSLAIHQNDKPTEGLFEPLSEVSAQFELDSSRLLKRPRIGMSFANAKNERVFAVASWLGPNGLPPLIGRKKITLNFKMPALVPGRYTVDVGFYDQEWKLSEEHYSLGAIEIAEVNYLGTTEPTVAEIGQIYVRSDCYVS